MKSISFAQKAFIVKDNKLLMVQKSVDDPFHPGEWEVPGGRIEFGENLTDHIQREVMEEVGLSIIPGDPFDMWTWIMTKGDNTTQVIAVARICKAVSESLTDSNRVEGDYLSEMRWINIDDVLMQPLISDIRPVVEKFVKIHSAGELK